MVWHVLSGLWHYLRLWSGVASLVEYLIADGAVWPVDAEDGALVTSDAGIKLAQGGLWCRHEYIQDESMQ